MERKCWYMGMVPAVLLCLVTMLWGCHRSTTVILPPETSISTVSATAPIPTATINPTVPPTEESTTVSTTEPSTYPTAEPSTAPTTEPATAPTTEPTTAPTTEPTTAPTTEPATAPTTEPTTAPTTEPTTAPTTEPTTAPTTEPTTAPTTEPTTAPTPEPTTAPTAEPTTAPTTEPTTAPTTEPTTAPATEPEPTRHPVYNIGSHIISSLEYNLLDGINQQRTEAELPSLTMDTTLCALASIRSYECTENFSHTRPDGRGAFSILSDYSYTVWSRLDERIHSGSTGLPVSIILKGWMNNDAFCASILSDTYTHIGIGVYNDDGITYITCLFAG